MVPAADLALLQAVVQGTGFQLNSTQGFSYPDVPKVGPKHCAQKAAVGRPQGEINDFYIGKTAGNPPRCPEALRCLCSAAMKTYRGNGSETQSRDSALVGNVGD